MASGMVQINLHQSSTFGPFMRQLVMLSQIACGATYNKIAYFIASIPTYRNYMVNMIFLTLNFYTAIITFTLLSLILFLYLLNSISSFTSLLQSPSAMRHDATLFYMICVICCVYFGVCISIVFHFLMNTYNTSTIKTKVSIRTLIKVIPSQWKPFFTNRTPLLSILDMWPFQRLFLMTPFSIIGTVAWRTSRIQSIRFTIAYIEMLSIGWQHLLTHTTLLHSFWDSTWFRWISSRCHTTFSTNVGKPIGKTTTTIEKLRDQGKRTVACVAFLHSRENAPLYRGFFESYDLSLLHQVAAFYASVFNTITINSRFPEVVKGFDDKATNALPLGRILGYNIVHESSYLSSCRGMFQHRHGSTLLPLYYTTNPPVKQDQGVL